MSAGGKTGAVVMCLVFGIPFGGVGAFGSWVMISAAHDWYAARDWVRVKADLVSYDGAGKIRYRYVMAGRQLEGTQLSVVPIATRENLSDEAASRLQAASGGKKPLMVFANPADPSQSVVDREMPWMAMVFMTPFALGFGGVGLGAFWMLAKILRGDLEKEKKPAKGPRMSEARSGLVTTWVVAFFWNVISFPIAMVAVPQLWASGEYLGLFVLIFPAVGALVVWAAIAATIGYIRRGGASLNLNPENPRAGSAVQGFIAFPRGVLAGQSFKTRLVCVKVTSDRNSRVAKIPKWSKEQVLRTTQTPGGVRLAFRFEVPADVPGSRRKDGDTAEYQWRVEATQAEVKRALPYGFEFDLQPAPADALAAEPAVPDEEPRLGPEFAKLESLAEARGINITGDDRAQLGQMTETQRELAVKALKALQFAPKFRKIAIWIVVAVVGFQIVGAIITLTGVFKN